MTRAVGSSNSTTSTITMARCMLAIVLFAIIITYFQLFHCPCTSFWGAGFKDVFRICKIEQLSVSHCPEIYFYIPFQSIYPLSSFPPAMEFQLFIHMNLSSFLWPIMFCFQPSLDCELRYSLSHLFMSLTEFLAHDRYLIKCLLLSALAGVAQWLSASLKTKGLPVCFPVTAHAWLWARSPGGCE